MKTNLAAYALMALATIADTNPDDQIKVEQDSITGGFTSLLVTDRYTREDCSTNAFLLKRYQAIAEAWGATAWVEWDHEHGELVIIIG